MTSPAPHDVSEQGYADPDYAASLRALGDPAPLPDSGGTLLRRTIGDSGYSDAVGPYPVFACRDWPQLAADLADLDRQLVSVGIVTDPFGRFRFEDLQRAFPARVAPYKEHFVVDLQRASRAIPDPHHRRNVRWAARRVEVARCTRPGDHLDEWVQLYGALKERHAIVGVAAFSRAEFALQLGLPGLVAFQALASGRVVGMALWLCRDDVAYYHLGAYNEAGYAAKASFALFAAAIAAFAGERRWLALGAGAGLRGDAADGLTRFKAGWATDRRTVYFCGRIGQPSVYAALTERYGGHASEFFPAYRFTA